MIKLSAIRINEVNSVDIFYFLRAIAILCVFFLHSAIIITSSFHDISLSWLHYTPAWSGVWIMITLSGYLIGKGFYNNKYKTNFSGMKAFWINRLIRIVPLYLFFIILMFIFVDFLAFIDSGYQVILRLLSFTFTDNGKFPSIGPLWFVSTIMQLYLLAPFAYKFIFKKLTKKDTSMVFFIILFLGLANRLIQYKCGVHWSQWTYTFSLSNLDLFFGGFFLNSITQNSFDSKLKSILRPRCIMLLFSILLINTYEMYGVMLFKNQFYILLCQYIYPSIYFCITALIIFAFDYKDKKKNLPLSFRNIVKNPLRIIEAFGLISFGFYLFHIPILNIITKSLKILMTNKIVPESIIFSFVLTIIMATITYFIIEKPTNKLRYDFYKGHKND